MNFARPPAGRPRPVCMETRHKRSCNSGCREVATSRGSASRSRKKGRKDGRGCGARTSPAHMRARLCVRVDMYRRATRLVPVVKWVAGTPARSTTPYNSYRPAPPGHLQLPGPVSLSISESSASCATRLAGSTIGLSPASLKPVCPCPTLPAIRARVTARPYLWLIQISTCVKRLPWPLRRISFG